MYVYKKDSCFYFPSKIPIMEKAELVTVIIPVDPFSPGIPIMEIVGLVIASFQWILSLLESLLWGKMD